MQKKHAPLYESQKAYFARLRAKGWMQSSLWLPKECMEKLRAYRNQLVAEYEATHPKE